MAQINPARKIVGHSTVGAAIALMIAATFGVEGGYVNNVNDPGGATNHGITESTARANGYTGNMHELSTVEASDIAEREYIEKPGLRPIIERDPAVGQKLFDAGYNAGQPRAARWLQESLNHLNNRGRDYADIPVDGKLSARTYAAYDAFRKRRGIEGCMVLLKMLDAKQGAYYMTLFGKNSKFEAFAFGWFQNRIGNVTPDQCGS